MSIQRSAEWLDLALIHDIAAVAPLSAAGDAETPTSASPPATGATDEGEEL